MGCMRSSSSGKVRWCNFQSYIYNHARLIGVPTNNSHWLPPSSRSFRMKWTLKDGIAIQNRADKINRNSGGEGAVSMTGLLEKHKSVPVCGLQKGIMRRKPPVLRVCQRDFWVPWTDEVEMEPTKVLMESKRFRMMCFSQWKEKNGLNKIQPNCGSECRAIKG